MSRNEAGAHSSLPARPKSGTGWLVVGLLAVLFLGFAVPLIVFGIAHQHGWELPPLLYPIILGAAIVDLVLTAWSGLAGLRAPRLPETPGQEFVPVTAIVRAEVGTSPAEVRETVEELLAMRYGEPIHIVLAYADPTHAEAVTGLRDIAADSTTLTLLPLTDWSRKVAMRAALDLTNDGMVAIFDAGQHPLPGCFGQAWWWLSHGYDAVHGQRAVNNGELSAFARLFAVDLQTATACPLPITAPWDDIQLWCKGGAFMLTDLARRLASGAGQRPAAYRLVHDRHLISWQLGPTSLRELWYAHQEDDLAHLRVPGFALWSRLRAGRSRGSRLALIDGVIWKPIYVWLSLQAFTLGGYEWWRHGNAHPGDWLPPIVLLLALALLPVAPIRGSIAWVLAGSEHRHRRRWYLKYVIGSWLFYEALKSTSLRAAQLRLIGGRRRPRRRDGATIAPIPVPVALGSAAESNDRDRIPIERARSDNDGITAPSLADDVAAPPTDSVLEPLEVTLAEPLGTDITGKFAGEGDQSEGLTTALLARLRQQEAELALLRARVDGLELRQRAQEDLRAALGHVTQSAVTTTDTDEMLGILSSLDAHPDQLVVLASVSQRAATLAGIVDSYVDVREALAAGALAE